MEHKTFHGNITPKDISRALFGYFNRGNYRVQQIGEGENIIVQIASISNATSGGHVITSYSIHYTKLYDNPGLP